MKKIFNHASLIFAIALSINTNILADDNILKIQLPSTRTEGDFIISTWLLVFAVVLVLIASAVGIYYGLKAQKLKKYGGNQILLNSVGIAITEFTPGTKGKVKIHGEIWTAVSDTAISSGDEVHVKEINLLVLKVYKV